MLSCCASIFQHGWEWTWTLFHSVGGFEQVRWKIGDVLRVFQNPSFVSSLNFKTSPSVVIYNVVGVLQVPTPYFRVRLALSSVTQYRRLTSKSACSFFLQVNTTAISIRLRTFRILRRERPCVPRRGPNPPNNREFCALSASSIPFWFCRLARTLLASSCGRNHELDFIFFPANCQGPDQDAEHSNINNRGFCGSRGRGGSGRGGVGGPMVFEGPAPVHYWNRPAADWDFVKQAAESEPSGLLLNPGKLVKSMGVECGYECEKITHHEEFENIYVSI